MEGEASAGAAPERLLQYLSSDRGGSRGLSVWRWTGLIFSSEAAGWLLGSSSSLILRLSFWISCSTLHTKAEAVLGQPGQGGSWERCCRARL